MKRRTHIVRPKSSGMQMVYTGGRWPPLRNTFTIK